MKTFQLSGQLRNELGKKASKGLRAGDQIPAVLYGGNEVLHFTVTELGLGKTIQVGALSFDGLEVINAKNAVVCAVKLTRAARGAMAKGGK